MRLRFNRLYVVPAIFWACAFITLILWGVQPVLHAGWDMRVYRAAMVSLRAGRDPYLDGIAVQRAFYALPAATRGYVRPFGYVYSPITLPLLRLLAPLPFWLTGTLYTGLCAAGIAATLWVAWQCVTREERRVFRYLMPAAIYFPGLLENENVFSGNVAYILYGFVFAAALLGWRRQKWTLFYVAVVAASCFKAPMLSLIAIPVVSTWRQWLPAALWALAGIALFVIQPVVWPASFHSYLAAVAQQFSPERSFSDFSSSPAGVIAEMLFQRVPFQVTSAVVYAACVLGVLVTLLLLRRRSLRGELRFKQFAPLVMIGAILLDPRIMEYDAAAITIPMALVLWRFFMRLGGTVRRAVVMMSALFVTAHLCAYCAWKATECCLLVGSFAAGAWILFSVKAENGDTKAPAAGVRFQCGCDEAAGVAGLGA